MPGFHRDEFGLQRPSQYLHHSLRSRSLTGQSIANALDTIATGLLSAALVSVTRPKLMVRPSRTTRASASTSDDATAFRKCVVWSTVVIGRKPRLAARIAITIAVSASAISAWPQTMPPCRHSRSENAILKIAPGCQSAGAPDGGKISSLAIE